MGAYQLKGVAQLRFEQWKSERVIYMGPLDRVKFNGVFLDRFFHFGMREAKVFEFINL